MPFAAELFAQIVQLASLWFSFDCWRAWFGSIIVGMPGWNNGGRAAVWSLRTGALGELSSVSCTVIGRISGPQRGQAL